jgi:hypothetical protein
LHAAEDDDWAEANRAKKRKRTKEKAGFGIVMEVVHSACYCNCDYIYNGDGVWYVVYQLYRILLQLFG